MDVPLLKNVAIAIDGGGIKGAMVTRALRILEESGEIESCRETFRLTAGTSTGSIIAAALPLPEIPPARIDELYQTLGPNVFRKRWWSFLWWLIGYRYPQEPLATVLEKYIKDKTMGDYWDATPRTSVVITAFDLNDNRSLFIKSYKDKYRDWPVVKAVLASSTVPTYFPVVEGRYVDGGVGAYMNPCYLAAWEIFYSKELGWNPSETTLISLGTGRDPRPGKLGDRTALSWVGPMLDIFLQAASDQQVNMVRRVFPELDFRRFQVNTDKHIPMDDPAKVPELWEYGKELAYNTKKDIRNDPPPDPIRKV